MIVRVASGPGRLARISLRDVPPKLRERAARPLLDQAARRGGWEGLREAVELTRAAKRPSGETYLVPAAAVEEALKPYAA